MRWLQHPQRLGRGRAEDLWERIGFIDVRNRRTREGHGRDLRQNTIWLVAVLAGFLRQHISPMSRPLRWGWACENRFIRNGKENASAPSSRPPAKASGLTQDQLTARLGAYNTFVSNMSAARRRELDVAPFLAVAMTASGCEPEGAVCKGHGRADHPAKDA